MKKLITLIAVGFVAGNLMADDFTITIIEPAGPLGQAIISNQLSKIDHNYYTQLAINDAEAISRAREKLRETEEILTALISHYGPDNRFHLILPEQDVKYARGDLKQREFSLKWNLERLNKMKPPRDKRGKAMEAELQQILAKLNSFE